VSARKAFLVAKLESLELTLKPVKIDYKWLSFPSLIEPIPKPSLAVNLVLSRVTNLQGSMKRRRPHPKILSRSKEN